MGSLRDVDSKMSCYEGGQMSGVQEQGLLGTFSEKLLVLTCCTANRRCNSNGDLTRGSDHTLRDSKVQFELPKTVI